MGAKRKGILIMVVALVLGLTASLITVRLLAKRESVKSISQPKLEMRMAKVIVAARDLPLGTVLSQKDLRLAGWPRKIIPSSSFFRYEDLIGRVVKAKIFAGEPISSHRLASKGSSSGLGVLIPPGMRAMTLEVDEELGASGFFYTGTKVDVIATGRPKGEGRLTKLVLQDLEVLSVVGEEGASRKNPKTIITLAINPEDAEKLALALNEGKVHLVVRNSLDKEAVATPGVSTEELLKVKALRTASEEAGQDQKIEVKVVELIYGEERRQEKFQR